MPMQRKMPMYGRKYRRVVTGHRDREDAFHVLAVAAF